MASSRSAMEFMERVGAHKTQVPRPRLAISELLVHTLPVEHRQLSEAAMLAYEGNPNPDRGESKPWPTQQVIDGDTP